MIANDNQLLERLTRDIENASELYKPTNYWSGYRDKLLPTIVRHGISEFRGLYEPIFMSFGVTHIPDVLVPEFTEMSYGHLTGAKRAIFSLLQGTKILPRLVSNHVDSHRRTLKAVFEAVFHLAAEGDPDKEILRISDSGLASPRDLFSPENHNNVRYTLAFLRYFRDYRWAKQFVEFSGISTILELGSGYGGQAEVLLKLYPHIRYILCDIPPQLYVAEQYLKAVFPGQVTGYLETADLAEINLSRTKRITMLASWQIERIKGEIDIFWNSASFQEMEPEIVENYAKTVQSSVLRYVYLKEYPEGQRLAKEQGEVGVLKKTTVEDYIRVFSEFSLIHRGDAVQVSSLSPNGNPYINSSFYDYFLFEKKNQ